MQLRGSLRDVGLNTIAFGMIIAIQQILVFPGLSRMIEPVDFAQVILLITISNIVVNVVGMEASKVALIRSEAYRLGGLPWDSPRLVLVSSAAVIPLLVIAAALAQVPWYLIVQYGVITLLGTVRSYATTPDKYQGAFHRVVLVHGIYAIGAVAGLLLVPATATSTFPFLVAETLSVITVMIVRWRRPEVGLTIHRTTEFGATMHRFLILSLIALLLNVVTYLDRLTITPLIGAGALAVYYSATALSSSLSLITNPMGNAMLARLGRMSAARRGQMFSRGLMLAAPLVLVCWVGSFFIALGGLLVLYPRHLPEALPLLPPVSLSAAFSNAVALLSPLLQRFLPARRLLWFYLPYSLVYLLSISAFSTWWGLSGFAWASALASAVLFTMYLAQLRMTARAASGNTIPSAEDTAEPPHSRTAIPS